MGDTLLLSSFQLGSLRLSNRMLMAPLTRNRAGAANVPTPLMATYYEQRAGAGLIVSEASQVCQQGQGYPATPGIHTEEQVSGWKSITEAVHKAGGKIFLQLWHVGRVSHPCYQPDGGLPVAPSAIPITAQIFTPEGLVDPVVPRALELSEIPEIVEQYRVAAENAMDAGFDGVEVHGANGYLLDQFLRDGSNKREDEYGGSVENRARLILEVVDAVCGVWGSDHVGVRISPVGTFNDMSDSDPVKTYQYLLQELTPRNLAYLHVVEALPVDADKEVENLPKEFYKKHYDGNVVLNSGYTKEAAEKVLQDGHADLVSFGVSFIANPDLPLRFEKDAPLNTPDQSTFYGGDEKGYTDYPFLE